MTSVRSQTARRQIIVDILSEQSIENQSDLQAELAAVGFDVTQATISRDLDDLGAQKVINDEGLAVYVIDMPTGMPIVAETVSSTPSSLAKVLAEVLVSAESAGTITVLRTPPGAAQYLASVIDRACLDEAVGTVAGDDTVFIATHSENQASTLADSMVAWAEGRKNVVVNPPSRDVQRKKETP